MQRFTHLPCPAASNSWLVKAAVALALLALAACVAAIVGTAGVSDSLALRDAPSVDVVVAEKVADMLHPQQHEPSRATTAAAALRPWSS